MAKAAAKHAKKAVALTEGFTVRAGAPPLGSQGSSRKGSRARGEEKGQRTKQSVQEQAIKQSTSHDTSTLL